METGEVMDFEERVERFIQWKRIERAVAQVREKLSRARKGQQAVLVPIEVAERLTRSFDGRSAT